MIKTRREIVFIVFFTFILNILGTALGGVKVAEATSRPKMTKVELQNGNLDVGSYPTLNITSSGCDSVQYNVYVYSPTKKVWENVSGGYTPAVKGNGTHTLKLNRPLHEGENSFSVWVKKAGAEPIDRGGYDDFLSYRVTAKGSESQEIPQMKTAEIPSSEQTLGVKPTLKVSSEGEGLVQYRVYLYSPDKKDWEDVTGGYTSAYSANTSVNLKLNKELHKGENSFSVWVKRNGKEPIDKGGYDTFLSYRINIGDSGTQTQPIPQIKTAEISVSEQTLGVKPTLKVSSEGTGEVQYRVYLYSPEKKDWEDVTGGYTSAYSANTSVNLKLNKELHEGENSFSVWVKRNGKEPIDKGGYDTFLSYRVTIGSSNQGGALPGIKSASINSSELKVGILPTLNIASTGSENVQYRVYLYSPTKKVWEDIAGGYTSSQNPSTTYAMKSQVPLHEGENSFSVWVKRAGKDPSNKEGYDNFLSYRVNVTAKSNTLPKITSVNVSKSEMTVGGLPTLSLKSSSDVSVEYRVYLYSQTKGVWDDVSNGYTSSSNPNMDKNIKITKPLQPGRNTFSIWVKKAGYSAADPAGYDTFVQEVVNVTQDTSKIAQISSATVDTSKMVLGNKPEITVSGTSGDKSKISYKAFFYSNSQKKWLDATSYTAGTANGSSTKLSLTTPLEEGSNKILIWAKRSSVSGEIYESFKELTINAVKPAPLKKKIVIDPGHGGKDPGAVSTSGTRERDIVLSVGTKLGNLLKSAGYNIVYTRTSNDSVAWDSSNQSVSLRYRSNFANTNGADLFVSIHCNSNSGTPATGTETFYASANPNKDKAFATAINTELVKSIGLKNRGVKSGNYWVLNNTNMAATIAELAFINNPSDEAKLKDNAFQDKCAKGIYNGIIKY